MKCNNTITMMWMCWCRVMRYLFTTWAQRGSRLTTFAKKAQHFVKIDRMLRNNLRITKVVNLFNRTGHTNVKIKRADFFQINYNILRLGWVWSKHMLFELWSSEIYLNCFWLIVGVEQEQSLWQILKHNLHSSDVLVPCEGVWTVDPTFHFDSV